MLVWPSAILDFSYTHKITQFFVRLYTNPAQKDQMFSIVEPSMLVTVEKGQRTLKKGFIQKSRLCVYKNVNYVTGRLPSVNPVLQNLKPNFA